ncbi:MAG: LacI family DNA-binding transcriptional regulator [Chloroflexi bacterium]|nr:LacI family DNA-binding transcriptional regulator [Chloroflexota bacterium]
MQSKRRITLDDVAREAGVSYQTVSRVINNHPSVAQQTRNRVEAVIASLGYQPMRAAQNLAGKHSKTLGIVSFGFEYYGPSQMVSNIEHAARAEGYDVLIHTRQNSTQANVSEEVDYFERWQVDGVLNIAPMPETSYDDMSDRYHVPVVQIDIELGDNSPSVVIDQQYGTEMVAEHLIKLGHCRICEISGPQNWFGAAARHRGWLNVLERHNLEPGLSVEGNWTAQSGYLAAQELLRQDASFTAVVSGNDQMALGAMCAFREVNLRVPEDVSIVGFDDIPEAAYFHPPLTTVRQDFAQLGELGIQYLIELIRDPDTPVKQHVIQPQMIQRLSTAPPPG